MILWGWLIHVEAAPPSGPKATPILETLFSMVSLGAGLWSASLLLDVNNPVLTIEDL